MKKQIKELAICVLISLVMTWLLGIELWAKIVFIALGIFIVIAVGMVLLNLLIKILNK